MENNWYLYRHLKPNGEVFYIGIGKTKNYHRAYTRHNRNKYWKNIFSKYGTFEVQILKRNLTREFANELEQILISWYRRKDCCNGTLVNMTDGGDGGNGIIYSDERRKEVSDRMTGKNNPMYGKDWRKEKTEEEIAKVHKKASDSLKLFYKNNTHHGKGKIGVRLGQRNSEESINKIRAKKRQPVLDTKNSVIFKSYKEAAAFLGVGQSCMRARLNGQNINLTSFVYLKDYTEVITVIDYTAFTCNITYNLS